MRNVIDTLIVIVFTLIVAYLYKQKAELENLSDLLTINTQNEKKANLKIIEICTYKAYNIQDSIEERIGDLEKDVEELKFLFNNKPKQRKK